MKSNEVTRENKGKKKVALILAAILLISAGMTTAYFTDHAAKMNEFTFGSVKSELTETNWDTSEDGKKAAAQVRPNMTLVKDPVISNTGTSDSYNFIAFRVPYEKYAAVGTFGDITVNGVVKEGQCKDFDVNGAEGVDIGLKDLFKHEVNSANWILVEDKVGNGYHEYVYAYATGKDASTGTMTALKKGQKTSALFTNDRIRTINLVEDEWATQNGCVTTENIKFNIPVRTYSIQTTDIVLTDQPGDIGKTDPMTVWKVVKGQVNSKYEGMAEANWGNVRGANNTKGDDTSVHTATGAKKAR